MTEATRAALIHLLTAALRLLTGDETKEVQAEEWKPRWLGDTNPAEPAKDPRSPETEPK